MSQPTIEVLHRDVCGSTKCRKIRKTGFIPGVIYGCKKPQLMISLEQKVVSSLANTPSVFSKVYTLALDGKKESVIAKDIQLNPITDEPIHIDFMRVDSSSEIHISVPIVFINEDKSPGLKKGGVLNVVLHSLEIVAKLDAIPEKITVDLSGVEASQSITLDKLNLSTNVKASHPERDHVIATIVAASNQESSEA